MGYLFTLATCSNEGKNYRTITYQLLEEYSKVFNISFHEISNAFLSNEFSKDIFDIINGASGTLLSLLHVYDIYGDIHYNLTQWIQKLTNLLEELIKQSIKENNFTHESITVDLGVSHGITGVINIVNASFKRGFGTKSLYSTLLQSKTFLLSLIEKYENSLIIPYGINCFVFLK